jgi:hypothetical protein
MAIPAHSSRAEPTIETSNTMIQANPLIRLLHRPAVAPADCRKHGATGFAAMQ